MMVGHAESKFRQNWLGQRQYSQPHLRCRKPPDDRERFNKREFRLRWRRQPRQIRLVYSLGPRETVILWTEANVIVPLYDSWLMSPSQSFSSGYYP